ncbi:hypothetical protein PHYPSEUDO_014866 [Phytophthora pseudosyringae]|uniref:Uncharacterized protein n=1 Tax=Phytophthora pseudosyringae TaxID=221518 RepID=A0A8T1W486_9STRA|nr:hypothetical protein PHYPSEUDO_014866 [Phytophthora pseudosyringae]
MTAYSTPLLELSVLQAASKGSMSRSIKAGISSSSSSSSGTSMNLGSAASLSSSFASASSRIPSRAWAFRRRLVRKDLVGDRRRRQQCGRQVERWGSRGRWVRFQQQRPVRVRYQN